MSLRRVLFGAACGLLALATGPQDAAAADGKAIVEGRCVGCHDIVGPAPATLDGVIRRKAPDLFYAGSKFNRAWLVDWLQNPTVIRASGPMFLAAVVSEGGKDRVAESSVKPCAARLSPEEARATVDYLMTLKDATMKTGVVDAAKKFSAARARQLFTKQLPCTGCHRARFGERTTGGISGPQLTDAGARLNPDWIYARIENPQHWDPKTWMPRIAMSHDKRELLTLLISSMK